MLLASVENRKLYLSTFDGMIISNNPTDSISQLNGLVESWLKRSVILNEASDNFPKHLDIDKLVKNYRASLLLHHYRQKIVEDALDTLITIDQELAYYEKNKEQYLLVESIIRGHIAAVSDHSPKLEKFYRNWRKNDTLAIHQYLNKYGEYRMEKSTTWYDVNSFNAMLPKGKFKISRFKKKGDLQTHNDGLEYFVKIIEVFNPNEIPPLSYIRENIRKVIIHKRKNLILENIETKLYNEYLKINKIRIYYTDN